MTTSEAKSFERDVRAYLDELPKLLEREEGKFVLIRSAEVVSLHHSYEEARSVGYQRFAGKPFLVKEVSSKDRQPELCRS
jgi:hypothetical protein